jgi:hypothetical protein
LSSPNNEDGVDDPDLLLELVVLDLGLIFFFFSFSSFLSLVLVFSPFGRERGRGMRVRE